MKISNLSDHPGFAKIIAKRGWHAWWTDSDTSLADYQAGIEAMVKDDQLPLALVAHDAGTYLGSVLLVEDDLAERPHYTPWIAALWVEPDARSRGVAAMLITAARAEAARLGNDVCYLCASPENAPYYLARGFSLLERDVAGLDIFIL